MRLYYTRYDVRRDQDVIHTGTQQCNVMVLRSSSDDDHFWYAKVLGIFHVNVSYIGEGNTDYLPRRIEFLWVRWYESEMGPSRLSQVRLPPTSQEDSFGFIDPSDVLRACHIIPLAKMDRAFPDGTGTSELAQDCSDWNSYIVNRCDPKPLQSST